MALSRTNNIHAAEHAPMTNCVFTSNIAVGDYIFSMIEFGALQNDSNVTNMTVSDDTNSGNYILLGKQWQSGSNQWNTMWMKVANASGKPTLTCSLSGNAAYFGQIGGTSYTGFAGTPAQDTIFGLVQQTQSSGNTTFDQFTGLSTNYPNSIIHVAYYTNGTFIIPIPTGWTGDSNTFTSHQIAASAGTSCEFTGNYNSANTGSGSIFQMVVIYDQIALPPIGSGIFVTA